MEEGLKDPKLEEKLGLQVVARPERSKDALAFYEMLEYQSSLPELAKFLIPNRTLMIEIQMKRKVDKAVSC